MINLLIAILLLLITIVLVRQDKKIRSLQAWRDEVISICAASGAHDGSTEDRR